MINFSEIQNSVEVLKRQLAAGEIDEKTFEDRLLDMIDVAEDGYYWMFGHESGRWFRHNGEHWIPDDPSRLSSKPSQTDSLASKPAPDQISEPEELPINSTWTVISLSLLVVLGGIIYFSSLANNL